MGSSPRVQVASEREGSLVKISIPALSLLMVIRPIRNETDYDTVLVEIDRLMGVAPGTPESDRLEVLVILVEKYESAHWNIDAPDPVSAIHHVMEARGLRQKDLAELIGSNPMPRRSFAAAVHSPWP